VFFCILTVKNTGETVVLETFFGEVDLDEDDVSAE